MKECMEYIIENTPEKKPWKMLNSLYKHLNFCPSPSE